MRTGRIPIHQKITRYLVTEALPGLPEGSELPTISELCDRFGVSGVQTVRDGMQPLVAAGYVETRYSPTRRWVVRRRLPEVVPTEAGSERDAVSGQLTAAVEDLLAVRASLTQSLAQLDARLLALREARALTYATPSAAHGVTPIATYRTLDDLADELISSAGGRTDGAD